MRDAGNVLDGRKRATRLREEQKPPSKLRHALKAAPLETALAAAHHEIRDSEQDNVGVESAHKLEQAAEGSLRIAESVRHSNKLKAYRASAYAAQDAPPEANQQQKRTIKKQYAAAKRSGQCAEKAEKGAEKTVKTAKSTGEAVKKVGNYVWEHRRGLVIAAGIFLVVCFFLNGFSSCAPLLEGSLSGLAGTTYPSADADMLGAEAAYSVKEAELQAYLDSYEANHDYNEYHFDLDEIGHDPYVLISILSVLSEGQFALDDIESMLQMLFDRQYTLTEDVVTETRYRQETRFDSDGTPYTISVPYSYTVCTVQLSNFDLSHLPVYLMDEAQLGQYATYMATLGNRPDLFAGNPNASQREEYLDYDVPPEALEDEQFAAMLAEAEKFLGYPYVWGGSSPSTSFDCSGFVSWVINHSGWNVGRLGAQGLLDICTRVSASNAKPGDLIFFQGTYDTVGASHVGIYVGENMMLHCGSPISYAKIDAPYYQQHFLAFGRLPSP